MWRCKYVMMGLLQFKHDRLSVNKEIHLRFGVQEQGDGWKL